jgi:formylglycine-generating enzyme required for sulfatase activity
MGFQLYDLRYSICFLILALTLSSTSQAQAPDAAGGKTVADKNITNSIGMKLVLIPAGEFMMGNGHTAEEEVELCKRYGLSDAETDCFKDEYPRHRVRITKAFYLGDYEVTRGQFRQFVKETGYKTDAEKGTGGKGSMGIDPDTGKFELKKDYSWQKTGFKQTDKYPVVNVSWNDAEAFCEWLSRKEGKTYCLPTEAEWEYACRAGTTTRYFSGDDPETLAKVGNIADASAKKKFADWKPAITAEDGFVFTAPVGKFEANAFGLYDMHGNVNEWCADWYEADYYATSPTDDPAGPSTGVDRVLRGGSCYGGPDLARSSDRDKDKPYTRYDNVGFRVVRTK